MAYVPWRGDVVWIDLEPQKGPEQAVHRPAVVLSRSDYNRKTRLAVICPITTQRGLLHTLMACSHTLIEHSMTSSMKPNFRYQNCLSMKNS